MAARDDQIDKLQQAAQYLRSRQAEVLRQGFNLQQIVVHIKDPGAPEGEPAAQVQFTWRDDHYDFTVQ